MECIQIIIHVYLFSGVKLCKLNFFHSGPVTFSQINPTDKERAASVGVRHWSFYALSFSSKYALCSVMFFTSVINSFCPVYVQNVLVFLPHWRSPVMFAAQSVQV